MMTNTYAFLCLNFEVIICKGNYNDTWSFCLIISLDAHWFSGDTPSDVIGWTRAWLWKNDGVNNETKAYRNKRFISN